MANTLPRLNPEPISAQWRTGISRTSLLLYVCATGGLMCGLPPEHTSHFLCLPSRWRDGMRMVGHRVDSGFLLPLRCFSACVLPVNGAPSGGTASRTTCPTQQRSTGCSSGFAFAMLFSLQLVLPAEGLLSLPQDARKSPDLVSRPC